MAGVRVRPLEELAKIVASGGISIGVIATPAGAAQDAADQLIDAGVTSILNFAPTVLSVPSTISVRKVDLAVELQILSYHEQRKANVVPATRPTVPNFTRSPTDRQRGATA